LALASTCRTAVFNVSLLDFANEVEEAILLIKRQEEPETPSLDEGMHILLHTVHGSGFAFRFLHSNADRRLSLRLPRSMSAPFLPLLRMRVVALSTTSKPHTSTSRQWRKSLEQTVEWCVLKLGLAHYGVLGLFNAWLRTYYQPTELSPKPF
jgi:hypothetical protein